MLHIAILLQQTDENYRILKYLLRLADSEYAALLER